MSESILPVAIIGGGLGGISTAIALQTQLRCYDYQIFEMSNGIGGTWFVRIPEPDARDSRHSPFTQENTYPGCACDIPCHWYSLSTELNPEWTQLYVGYKEIRSYWERVAEKHKILSHIQFFSEVLSLVWDEDSQTYTINIKTHVARKSDEFGLKSVDFSGKKVAVIGNGCSATQIVPKLAEDSSTSIVEFCRTPSWFVPRVCIVSCSSLSIPDAFSLAPSHCSRVGKMDIPEYAMDTKSLPLDDCCEMDMTYLNWKVGPFTSMLRRQREKACIERIKRLTPEKYHENLIPKFPMGCKRIIYDPGYLESLQRQNVELEWDPITEITDNGITTESGKHYEFDIICFATGFDIENSSSINIKGAGGKTTGDYFREQGGPTGYMGTTIPGFPNLFTLLGPNTATGHGSVIHSEEVQINYAMQLIKPIIRGHAKSFAPRADATKAYNDRLQEELKHTVWTSCISWYHAGEGRRGKLMTWPATQTYMWWMMRTPIWRDYDTTGGEKWLKRRQYASAAQTTLEWLLIGAGLGTFALMKLGKWEYTKQLIVNNASGLIKGP
ncbi:L-lysine 6-monooxygenase (NADPH-requiring) [Rhizoctonia solani]|uniref:L-lysine 6-monooxygenase (NADPH-requiring) n=1 Tax=Rhizoctonia solani TaxID=456999 RepID=A0A8H7IIP5_9AGAM|nr:L-lysine 6-monooxygenase (NADPH-requiring) [Rhizoctonia solani]